MSCPNSSSFSSMAARLAANSSEVRSTVDGSTGMAGRLAPASRELSVVSCQFSVLSTKYLVLSTEIGPGWGRGAPG